MRFPPASERHLNTSSRCFQRQFATDCEASGGVVSGIGIIGRILCHCEYGSRALESLQVNWTTCVVLSGESLYVVQSFLADVLGLDDAMGRHILGLCGTR